MRRTDGAVPIHRDPDTERIRAHLARFRDAVHAAEASLPRFRLDAGDILVLDNYRCWHGRDGHTGNAPSASSRHAARTRTETRPGPEVSVPAARQQATPGPADVTGAASPT